VGTEKGDKEGDKNGLIMTLKWKKGKNPSLKQKKRERCELQNCLGKEMVTYPGELGERVGIRGYKN